MKTTFLLMTLLLAACGKAEDANQKVFKIDQDNLEIATLAGGCFWCVEAAIEQIKGVQEVVSGYSGDTKETANYKDVSTGRTKHAEAVQVYYDPNIISYEVLLDIFFTAHDPTQLNRQGPDYGPQYRTAIFYHNAEQKAIAEKKIKELNPKYDNSIVTEVVQLDAFYKAEEYHQDYQKRNPYQPYIMSVSKPKVEKVKKKFPDLLKDN